MLVYDIVFVEDLSTSRKAALLSLQGLANRRKPALFLLPAKDGPEAHWMKWYEGYGLQGRERSFEDALETCAGAAKAYVIFDPARPATLNIAMAAAGVHNAVAAGPEEEGLLKDLGLPCALDLRERQGGAIQSYRWAFDTLFPLCDSGVLANYEDGVEPRVLPTMDFLVAHKGFCMGLSINGADYPEEAALWAEVQTAAKDHAMMLGWHTARDSEATHVHFGSRHNVWVYCARAWNMSFNQHIEAKSAYLQHHCERAECKPGGRYVTITLSDGDSWHSMADVQKDFWLHPRRGEVPLGWEIAPIFAQAAPAVLEYYYETATENDYLVCGPSGIGYNYLTAFDDWRGFLERSARIMECASLRTIWVINRDVRHLPGGVIEHRLKNGPIRYTRQDMEAFGGIKDQNGADWVDPQMVERYMTHIPDALGFFQGWERIPGEDPRWVGGRLWCPAAALVRNDTDAVIAEFEQAAGRQPRPVFLAGHVNCYDATMDAVIEAAERMKARGYEVVRPDVFLALAKDAHDKKLRE